MSEESSLPQLEAEFMFDSEPCDMWKEAKQLANIMWPVTITSMLRWALGTTDSAFVGRLGTEQLAGVTLADVWMSCVDTFAYCPAWVLNTLCAQAIGAGNPKLAGKWLQLALVVCGVSSVVCMGLYWLTGPIVSLTTSNHQEILYSGLFGKWASSWLLMNVIFGVLTQYFASFEVVLPETIIKAVFAGLNVGMNQILIHGIQISSLKIHWKGLGFSGSPLATLISITCQLIVFYVTLCVWKKYHLPYWGGWSLDSFQRERVKTFLKMAAPLTIAVAVDEWGFQVVNFFTGRLPPADTASMSVLWQFLHFSWAFFWGLGLGIQTRIGNLLGGGHVKTAKIVVKMAVGATSVAGIIIMLVSWFTRNLIGEIYSKDPKVIQEVADVVPFAGLFFLVGSVGWAGQAVLEGMGKNALAAGIYAVGVWVIYVPLAIYTAFFSGWGCAVCWIWYCSVIAEFAKTIAVWVCLWRMDWYEISKEARDRALSDGCEDNEIGEYEKMENEDVELKEIGKEEEIDPKHVSLLSEEKSVAAA